MAENARDGPVILSSREKLINWWKAWPVILGLVMLSFNVEMVIMNILSSVYNIRGWNLFYFGATLGNIEMIFWIWLIGKIGIFIKENPGFRYFYNNIKTKGFDNLFRKTLKIVADRLDPENQEYLDKIKNIKIGYFDMLLFGICFGAWILGIIIFRTTRWYRGLIMLMLGNTIKLGIFAAGYSVMGWIFTPILIATFIFKIKKIFK